MKINLPTVVEVEVNDLDLLELLKKKRLELLSGALYAEQEENKDVFWLWAGDDIVNSGTPTYRKYKEITETEYRMIESLATTIYYLQQTLQAK